MKLYNKPFWASWCAGKVLQSWGWQEVLPVALVLGSVELLLGRTDLLAAKSLGAASSICSDNSPTLQENKAR